jgi:hypothetical protein
VEWFRLHSAAHSALYFGRSGTSHFDAPGGEYGVLYLADSPHCAIAETFGRLDQMPFPLISAGQLGERGLALVEFTRDIEIVDLSRARLAQLRADNRLGVGDHRIAQRWSLAPLEHPTQPGGLLYRSRHDPSHRCLALFDRAASVVTASDLAILIDPSNTSLLAEILDTYGFGLLE